MKEAALNLLLVIITAVDNINQNTLLEYLMLVDFFDSFIQVCCFNGVVRKSFLPIFIFMIDHLRSSDTNFHCIQCIASACNVSQLSKV